MSGEVVIKLTDEQKRQMKQATGQEHEEIKVETVGTKLAPRVAPKALVGKKRIMAKKLMAKKLMAKKLMAKKLMAKKLMAKKLMAKKLMAKKLMAKSVKPLGR